MKGVESLIEYSRLRASGNPEKSRDYTFENPGIGISKKSRDPGISRDPAGACLRVTSLNKAFNIFPFSNACQYPFDQNATALPTFTCLSRLELFVVFVFFAYLYLCLSHMVNCFLSLGSPCLPFSLSGNWNSEVFHFVIQLCRRQPLDFFVVFVFILY